MGSVRHVLSELDNLTTTGLQRRGTEGMSIFKVLRESPTFPAPGTLQTIPSAAETPAPNPHDVP